MKIQEFFAQMSSHKKTILYVVGALGVTVITAGAMYFSNGSLFKGDAGGSAAGYITCSAIQNNASGPQWVTGKPLTWKLNLTLTAPNYKLTKYGWNGDGLNVNTPYFTWNANNTQATGHGDFTYDTEKTITYAAGITTATMNVQALIEDDAQHAGSLLPDQVLKSSCTIPLQDPPAPLAISKGIAVGVQKALNPAAPAGQNYLPATCSGVATDLIIPNPQFPELKKANVTWSTNISGGNTYNWNFIDEVGPNANIVPISGTQNSTTREYTKTGVKALNVEIIKGGEYYNAACTVEVKDPASQPAGANQGGVLNNPGAMQNVLEDAQNSNSNENENPVMEESGQNESPVLEDEQQVEDQAQNEAQPSAENNNSQQNSAAGLKPAISSLLSCAIDKKTMSIAVKEGVIMKCALTQQALVSAMIVKGGFDPKKDMQQQEIVRTILSDNTKKGNFNVGWSGSKEYDLALDSGDLGEYSFVVGAKIDSSYEPDYSIQKFEVNDLAPEVATTQPQGSDQNPEKATTQNEPKNEYQPQTQTAPEVPAVLSKCPGVYQPIDIAGHWGEQIIMKAVDNCIVTGFADRKFYPDLNVTRAQAAKIVVAAVGGKPHAGCRDVHCGANYQNNKIWTDIKEYWEGAWLRSARDLNIYFGYIDGTSGAGKPITRGEAVVLVARALSTVSNFRLRTDCYTANCGAGAPNNIFIDINDDMAWLGPALRALTDAAPGQIVTGKAPFIFDPTSPITRAELTKIIMRARELILKQP